MGRSSSLQANGQLSRIQGGGIRAKIISRTSMRKDNSLKNEQILVGDTVRFQGGGSSMTVEAIEGAEAICAFALGGTQRLRLEVLEKVPQEHHWWGHK